MKNLFYLTVVGLLLSSCGLGGNENPNALKEPMTYTAEEIGWTVEIPAGWEVIGDKEKEELDEKGHDKIEDATNLDIDASNVIDLISIKKNETNSLISTIEPFPIEYRGEFEYTNEYIKELMIVTYRNEGMDAEVSPTEIETIDGLDFYTYGFKIYKEGEMVLQQSLYSRWINGYDFAVAMTYTDDEHRDEMMDIFKSSKFVQAEEPDWGEIEVNEAYLKVIDKADSLFNAGYFEEALGFYQRGSDLRPDYYYPANMVVECNNRLAEISESLLD